MAPQTQKAVCHLGIALVGPRILGKLAVGSFRLTRNSVLRRRAARDAHRLRGRAASFPYAPYKA